MIEWAAVLYVVLFLATPLGLIYVAVLQLAWAEQCLEREPPRSAFPGKLTIGWWDEHR